ncbi:Hypothetical predicted protein [Paramuricea clavata]|uniref:Uncharacterized protein n=1 Tax=Paramuricea clavata TaxID=317549 RepID=A0A6S7IE73_PARCT|nr:Hypothetical predicted protein [Paramuricea clavata]
MSKRARQDNPDEPVEVHDSGFMTPMIMFPTFPHNDTFVDNRTLQVNATPVDSNADVYTFIHHKQEYGIMNLQDATISATISLKDRNNNDLANDQNVSLNMLLRMFWKTKEILINDQRINSVTSQENELVYISHLLRETTPLECYDSIDIMGDNKRFVPTSFEIKVILQHLEKNKCLFGADAQCQAAFIHYDNLQIRIPAMKPKLQLTQAINQTMIQNGEECKYYITSYRYVPTPVAAGTSRTILNDIFAGSRPSRVMTYLRTQTCYNGSHILDPILIPFPNLEFFGIKINDAYVNPCVENSCEAYTNLRRVLNRCYDEMPFSHADYQTSYGIIVTDLSPNKDSYNQVLPNSTSGVVSLEMRLSQNLTANSQLINIGEFRNQLSVGYQMQARLKYDF